MLGLGLMLMPAPPRRGPWSAPPCSLDGCRVPWPPSPPPSRAMPTRWASLCRGGGRGGAVGLGPASSPCTPGDGIPGEGVAGVPWAPLGGTTGCRVLGAGAACGRCSLAGPRAAASPRAALPREPFQDLRGTRSPPKFPGGSAWSQAGAAAPGWGGLGQLAQEPSSALPRSSSSQRRSRITPRRSWMCWTPKRS